MGTDTFSSSSDDSLSESSEDCDWKSFPDEMGLCEIIAKRTHKWYPSFRSSPHAFQNLPRKPSACWLARNTGGGAGGGVKKRCFIYFPYTLSKRVRTIDLHKYGPVSKSQWHEKRPGLHCSAQYPSKKRLLKTLETSLSLLSTKTMKMTWNPSTWATL